MAVVKDGGIDSVVCSGTSNLRSSLLASPAVVGPASLGVVSCVSPPQLQWIF